MGSGLPRRLWLLLLVLAVENTLAVQIPHPWFNIYLYRGSPIVFGLALIFFGRQAFRHTFQQSRAASRRFVVAHLLTFAALAGLETFLHYRYPLAPYAVGVRLAVVLWLVLFAVLVATLLLSFLSLERLFALAKNLGTAWLYATTSAVLVILLRERMRLAWGASSSRVGTLALEAAFHQSEWLLRLFYPIVVQDPATHILGTPNFLVLIGGTCSGLEGLALMSAFSAVWFVYARHELRLRRAVLLVPVALGLMWISNIVRLVVLIAIGDAGYPQIATQGFHSEAGWIAFNIVSLGFLVCAQKVQWFRDAQGTFAPQSKALSPARRDAPTNIAAVYLAPFLAVTAASVASQATSAGFEWLYPLRFFFALAALWVFRREYARMDWSFGPLGIATGVGVAAFWLLLRFLPTGWHLASVDDGTTAAGLASLTPALRYTWIGLRILAVSLTVPLAEELAFRGFIARRFMSERPEKVPYAALNALAILGSSVAFGLVHGRMWLAGILAGVAFAFTAKLRDRIGEAFAAHATANLLIALVALIRHDYGLW